MQAPGHASSPREPGSLAVESEQDRAALAADTAAFVKSVHDVDETQRQVAISATIFGVADCVL